MRNTRHTKSSLAGNKEEPGEGNFKNSHETNPRKERKRAHESTNEDMVTFTAVKKSQSVHSLQILIIGKKAKHLGTIQEDTQHQHGFCPDET
jgi:hypothetical protein